LLCQAVIRLLPPSMTAEEFMSAVDPLPDHNFFYFSKADHGLGQFSFSRAYINFLTFRDFETFRDKFDGYVFVDSRGNEYPAAVQFAPFQKIPQMYWNPKFKDKRDKKCGTIEEDADYMEFVESLSEKKKESLPSAETYLEEMEARDKEIKANKGCPKVITPLIEYVLAKHSGKYRQKDDRRSDDRKHRADNRIRDDRGKKKEDGAMSKNKNKDRGEKSGLTRKERRNEKRKRDRKEKQAAGPPDGQPTVRVLQKEKSHPKPSPNPKTVPSAPVTKNTASSSQSISNKVQVSDDNIVKPKDRTSDPKNKAQSDTHKTKRDRNPPAAAASVNHSKPDANIRRDSGDKTDKPATKVKRDDVKKDRIPNKERPAIQIYRPGSRRTGGDGNGPKADSDKSRDPAESVKPADKRSENGRPSERKAPGEKKGDQNQKGNRSDRQQKAPSQPPSSKSQVKSESGAPFRTKVFKSNTRKPGSGPDG
jgi:regulator of nonsense transcripts 3